MISRIAAVLIVLATPVLAGSVAHAQAPKELTTQKNKPVVLGNFLSAPNNCGTNPGPVPFPKLREKPSRGGVGLQIVMADVAPTDTCPARKMPSIALFYTPNKDFVGKDSVQVEFETGDAKSPSLGFLITVEETDGK